MTGELKAGERELLAAFLEGKARALARAISWVENARPGFERWLAAIQGRVGSAHRIGVTGPPGSGKSTLIRALAPMFRMDGGRVGVIAVDPSSPFSGGALLGDRIRMAESAEDEGVFIRSMASRGSLGGLATTTQEVADVMDAFGFDRVVVETVGVGQSELEIAGTADTTVVVVTPESGDAIQAMKAGLMEIADIFVLNKRDRPGADRAARELETMLHLRAGRALRGVPAHHGIDLSRLAREVSKGGGGGGRGGRATRRGDVAAGDADRDSPDANWEIPVLATQADSGEGVTELHDMLDAHRRWLETSGALAERRRLRRVERVRAVVDRAVRSRVWDSKAARELLGRASHDLESEGRTAYDIAEEIVERLGLGSLESTSD